MLILVGQQMCDGRAPFGIAARRHHARRLVHQQHDGGAGRQAQRLAIDIDAVNRWIGARPQFGHDVAVDQNATLRNQFFSGPPARNAAARDQLLQSLAAPGVSRVLMPRAQTRFRFLQVVLVQRILDNRVLGQAAFIGCPIVGKIVVAGGIVQKSLGVPVNRD